jgi:Tfp pilus assembly protein PilX
MTTMQLNHTRPRYAQQGAASLLVALMLLLGGTIIAFFANRSFIFEQRTSANQYRATKAFELAEAGTEWALGKLNENMPLQSASSCLVGGTATNATFRTRYAAPQAAGDSCPPMPSETTGRLCVDTTVAPGCRIDAAGAAVCDCPTAAAASLGAPAADEQGRFAVRFARVAGDRSAIEIISRGCVNVVGDTACDPSNVGVQSDATATVRVIAKVVPSSPAGPGAALTAASVSVTNTGTVLNVVNSNQRSNGITINAGGAVPTGSTPTGSTVSVYSMPGTPSRASIIDGDASLVGVTTATESAFFARFFGQPLNSYSAADPDVIRISGADAAARGAEVMSYINRGLRAPRFFVPGDVTFDSAVVGGGALGSAFNPVVIAATGNLSMSGNFTAHGIFYAAAIDATGAGTTTVNGALVTRGAFSKASGTLNLIYDLSLWSGTLAPHGRLARVPGSWRDKATDY